MLNVKKSTKLLHGLNNVDVSLRLGIQVKHLIMTGSILFKIEPDIMQMYYAAKLIGYRNCLLVLVLVHVPDIIGKLT